MFSTGMMNQQQLAQLLAQQMAQLQLANMKQPQAMPMMIPAEPQKSKGMKVADSVKLDPDYFESNSVSGNSSVNASKPKNVPKALPKRILVTKLPPHVRTMEAITEAFYPYGIISEVQIFKEPAHVPKQLMEELKKVDNRMGALPAALVEFETSQAAKFAVSIMRKREKTLQFRVALMKGDSVDPKHIQNNQAPKFANYSAANCASSNRRCSEALSLSDDMMSSSGYDTCSSIKSESPQPRDSIPHNGGGSQTDFGPIGSPPTTKSYSSSVGKSQGPLSKYRQNQRAHL
ncbi:Oidioi.mRNA.OKI2018_I69.PAR.g9489.t1.cds [Oikopleura dioica]|uniref:Oidioi.mRNA.OKI2018_I69.PAR.g9489.t1.cds n=1 Tax=Oikopleura dioica TaxID=34765 RepID=A0ABN7RRB6_OIKDI|nr:Oidioi.mRNA.OKI2018_I69.PAR.g9489.t1.cds [Oikopleura dioica]